jgi:MFS family permease
MKTTNRWAVLIFCWLIWGLLFGDRMILIFTAPMLLDEFRISLTQFGFAVSCLTISWAVMAGIAGFISDRVGRRKVILPAMILFSATTWLTGLVRSIPQLLIIRGLVGIGEGSYWGPGVSLINSVWPAERRGFALGFHQTGAPILGVFLTGALTGWIALKWGWRAPFVVYAIAGFVLCALVWAIVGEPKEKAADASDAKHVKGSWKMLFTSRAWILNLVIMVLVMIMYWSITAFLPIYLTKTKGMNIAVAVGVAGITGLAGLFGMWITGLSSDYIGRKVALIIPLILILIGIPLVLTVHSLPAMIVALVILGYGIYGAFPITLAIVPAEASPPELVATGVGLTMFMSEVAGIVGPIVGGLLNDFWGITASFWLAFIVTIACIGCAVAMGETKYKAGVRLATAG